MPRSGPFCLTSPLSSLGLPLSGAVGLLPLLGAFALGVVGQTLQVKALIIIYNPNQALRTG